MNAARRRSSRTSARFSSRLASEDSSEASTLTPNYGYRVAIDAEHADLLTADATLDAIDWADSPVDTTGETEPGVTVYRHANYNEGLPELGYNPD